MRRAIEERRIISRQAFVEEGKDGDAHMTITQKKMAADGSGLK
jgi:hypothetical protein